MALYVPCVVGDLPETLGPAVAAPGKVLHRLIDEMDLHPVGVELDFVKPSLAGRDTLDGCRERGFNEARKRGLRANGGLFDPQRKARCPATTPLWTWQSSNRLMIQYLMPFFGEHRRVVAHIDQFQFNQSSQIS
jgi:hypothetical protein